MSPERMSPPGAEDFKFPAEGSEGGEKKKRKAATYFYENPENAKEIEKFADELPNDIDSLLDTRAILETEDAKNVENLQRLDIARSTPSKDKRAVKEVYHKGLDKLYAVMDKLRELGYTD